MNKYQALVDMIEHGNNKGALDALEKLRDEDREKSKCVEEMVQEFRKTFADDNLWKDEINETAFVAIGNIENWIRDTLTTLIQQTRKERDAEIVEFIGTPITEPDGLRAVEVDDILNHLTTPDHE